MMIMPRQKRLMGVTMADFIVARNVFVCLSDEVSSAHRKREFHSE